MKHLLTFLRHDVSATLALTVGSPSFDRRYSALKHLAFMLLFIISSLNVWGADEVYKTATFSSSSFSAKTQTYNNNSFYSTTNGFRVDITNANNNNKGWEYIKMGYGSSAVTGTITTNDVIDAAITKVGLTIDAITANKVKSIKLFTKTTTGSWTEVGTFDKSQGTNYVTLSSPAAKLYYKIEVSCAAQKAAIQLSQVQYYKSGTQEPTV